MVGIARPDETMSTQRPSETPIRVVAICGSLRPGSYTRMALQTALRGAADLGASTQLIDLRDYELVFCDGKQDESRYPQDVFRLRQEVRAAHGIILGTPEYHGGMSGVLKNALDLMGFDELEGKLIGLVGVSGGRFGAVTGMDSLRVVGRALHAWVLPEQVAIPQAWETFDAAGDPKDPELRDRLLALGVCPAKP